MPSYKFTYFDMRGRGEATRLIFAYAGVPYTDDRVKKEEWPARKPNTPYGSMPVLEVDGEIITGSTIISRYLGELPEFNLAGSNLIENTQIAGLGGFLTDLELQIVKIPYAKDDATRQEIKKDFAENQVPKFFDKLESLSSKSSDGYLWGNKATWVDFYLYQLLEWIPPFVPSFQLEKYPSIFKLKATIENIPNIAKWLKDRPQGAY